ncbi:HAMP domain-containing protein [Fulvivirgaceae bacterium PWU4]|uniref:histidine kinase n=1 Tax=Chryseosolibacter histidini TaxID=2782349 RepID=A0AAP2DH98_9BACT|nr:ATP-binding protein [Chryseosolibacter histidini]MBT1695368.1 HAMP domain-containing protein [Chryseosolibacter histidini]
MLLRHSPIKRKIRWVILLTSAAVLLFTFSAYFVYEVVTFRQTYARQLSVLAKIVANNSTAALAFNIEEDANEILLALKAEKHILAAALYDKHGNLFTHYSQSDAAPSLPRHLPQKQGSHHFEDSNLVVLEPVTQNNNALGMLYLKSDMDAMYDRLRLYATIGSVVIALSFVVAYVLSNRLQRSISRPVHALTRTAKVVSEQKDYSVRALKSGNDEIGYLTDAFNQMLAEIQAQNERIQSFNQELELTIEKRTHDLEAVNKELEAFSYSVSHDLRAPLRSINGFSRILLEDHGHVLGEEGVQTLNTIMRNGLRMGQLIDDLLAFSRLGKQSVTRLNLDMTSIAKTVTEELKGQYGNKTEVIIKQMPQIQGDSSMLRQVMQNLVSNALKYSMKKERPVVEIGSFKEHGEHVFYVKDNGAGFNMEYYNKLFGVFQRLHNGGEFEGTGVGLALVHRIITKHNGRIWAEAKENEGATFYFSIPSTKNETMLYE